MTAAAAEVAHLTVRRAGRVVLDDLHLTVQTGEVLALIGPNGAGKSTLLRTLLGLLPASGTITVAGRNAATLSARERARLLGFVPQRAGLSAPLRVAQVVLAGRYAWGRAGAGDTAAVATALDESGAGDLVQRVFSELSCGEQQRVLIARALVGGAPLLLLDEPTASLDPGHALRLLALLRSLAAGGRSVVIALHQLDHVAAVADRVALLDAGRLVTVGTPTDVLSAGPLRAVFGVEPVPGHVMRAAPDLSTWGRGRPDRSNP